MCNDNATLVPTGDCTSKTIASFSVDCPQVNGTLSDYTTLLASSAAPRSSRPGPTLVSTPSAPVVLSASSEQGSTTPEPVIPSASSTTEPVLGPQTSLLDDVRSSLSLVSQLSSSPASSGSTSIPTSGSISTMPSTSASPSISLSASNSASNSPSPSPTPSQGQAGSGNDGGLSGPQTIALAVIIPGLGVIVAIIFGVRKWNNKLHEVVVSDKHLSY